jgi:hypothetical protein
MQRLWLREIYVWAGEYRQVNMTKGEFMFAAANQVPRLMEEFGRGPLREYTPCRFANVGIRGGSPGPDLPRVLRYGSPAWNMAIGQ